MHIITKRELKAFYIQHPDAKNHLLRWFRILSKTDFANLPGLKEVFVYDKGCSTYDLPRNVVEEIGLPVSASHPQEITHYMGLYFMASRGAQLVDSVQV